MSATGNSELGNFTSALSSTISTQVQQQSLPSSALWNITLWTLSAIANSTEATTAYPLNGSLTTVTSNVTSLPTNMTSSSINVTSQPTYPRSSLPLYHLIVNVFIVGSICLAGITGNVLSIIVFSVNKERSSTFELLRALAVADCLLLMLLFIHYVVPSIYPYTGYLKWYMDFIPKMMRYTWPTGYVFMTISNWLILAVAVDRYHAVCRPFKASEFCTLKRARITIVIVVIMAILFILPNYLGAIRIGFFPCVNNPTAYCFYNIFIDNLVYGIGYRIVLHLLCLYVVPITILVYVNYNLILALKRADARRKTMTKREKEATESRSLTRSFIVVIMIYLGCATPTFLSQFFLAFRAFIDPQILVNYQYYFSINIVLIVINSAANFFVYAFIGARFRQILFSIICCCRPALRHQGSVSSLRSHQNAANRLSVLSKESRSSIATVDDGIDSSQ
ncbi:FMRFamide receptor-like [Lingula anatina]|uniref:FMRFamide receptor-like n=1 Tax=Lingula anatina TaxID=7574 RepID=A0A2R2MKJ1_LINAN|nr:FMRFamide receptor-like [Lingula anatina]|eukprot:XP_023930718.1 FMRFamide receptor-like [Lingula anatina]